MQDKISTMLPLLNEKQRRLFLASEAKAYGWGGVSEVSKLSGVSRTTIRLGLDELESGKEIDITRVRKVGGGRNCIEDNHPEVQDKIKMIVDSYTYGDPKKIISYTTDSLRTIQDKLVKLYGIEICFKTVGTILEDMGYSLRCNQKMLQVGEAHPDRNSQFEFIEKKSKKFIKSGEPVISVDTKKKENIGNFKNNGREYRMKGDPRKVLDHDFPLAELGKISPYGVYVLNNNTGFVNVGTSHDTVEFAVESISRW
jgi:hypothetical protein